MLVSVKLLCLFGCLLYCTCKLALGRPAAKAEGDSLRHSGQDGAEIAVQKTSKGWEVDDDGGRQNFRGMEPRLSSLEKAVNASNGNDTNDTIKFYEQSWFIPVMTVTGLLIIIIISVIVGCCICCCRKYCGRCLCCASRFDVRSESTRPNTLRTDIESEGSIKLSESESQTHHRTEVDIANCDKCFRSFLDQHPEYQERGEQRMELGSRMQKWWYQIELKDNNHERKIVTILPVPRQCPLKLHKHQSGLNKLLRALKEHPYLHSIELVEYLSDHELLVMVQPLIEEGSLKDKIYKASPLSCWFDKYSHRSRGLHPETIARYGKQILEAMKFLYSKGFPTLGHIQSGNIFIVDDVCHLGGYENTLLGYKTRIYRLCKDHLQHFDIILFGHLVFEMAAGYQLTQLRPSEAEYKTVDKKVKPILKYIFDETIHHDVAAILSHEFFSDSLLESSDLDLSLQQVQLSVSMNKVLEKVREGEGQVQKSTKQKEGTETRKPKLFCAVVLKFGRGNEDLEGYLKIEERSRKKLKVKDANHYWTD